MTPPSPPERAALPAWARALRLRRAELGKSQERVALDSGILNQTTVSELEGAKYEVGNLTTARLAGLARGLDWTLAELEEGLGVDFGLSGMDAPGSGRGGPPIPPRLEPVDLPLEIPPGLQEAIDRYSGVHPEFTVEQNLRAITSIYRYGGGSDFTPEEWLDIMAANRRWLVRP